MLEQHARVIQSSAEGLWVEAAEPAGCELCGGRGCASRQISQLFQWAPRRYRLEPRLDLAAGDLVIVGIPEGSILRSALYLYGFPLLLLLTGTLIGQAAAGESAAILGALVGALGAWILTAFNRTLNAVDYRSVVIRYQPVIAIPKEKE